MLYVTTRNSVDAYTAYKALTNDCCSDGGVYVPFHLTTFDDEERLQFKDKSFNQTIAEILNMFFSLGLNGRDLDLEIGRTPIKVVTMNHRIITTELWHNVGGNLRYLESALCRKISKEINASVSESWFNVAIRIAVIFGIYGQLLRDGIIEYNETFDFSVNNDTFVTPLALWYCRAMGLPINVINCACDESNTLWDFIHRGTLITTNLKTGLCGNLERLIYMTLGYAATREFAANCESKGVYKLSDDNLSRFNKGLFCSVAGKDRAQTVINSVYRSNSYIAAPGTALCYGAVQDYRVKSGNSIPTVILAEDSPLNYISEISSATGLDITKIKSLAG